MDILLNNIIGLSDEEINNSKIELNSNAGTGGRAFIDTWLSSCDDDKYNGTCKECGYWAGSEKRHNFRADQWVFSFVRINSRNDEWLLASASEILSVPDNGWATDIKILERFKPLFGRLIIKCKNNNTYGQYTFNMSNYIEKAVVKEILPCLYSGEKFNGYDNVHLDFYKLNDIFSGKIMPSYREALEQVSGVYCLTDRETGCLYIGSAYSENGVAGRWDNYLDTKHGGNKKLIKLFNEKGAEYFEKNFTFTLLEYFNLSYDKDKIIKREQYWKMCFDTINNGYNDN